MRTTRASLALFFFSLSTTACGVIAPLDDVNTLEEPAGGAGSTASGGSAQGGSGQGASAQGGSVQGGSAQGGSAQGGSTAGTTGKGGDSGTAGQGGSGVGGQAQGGEGGNPQGGEGGTAQGGQAQGGGGSAQGGEGGQAQGGGGSAQGGEGGQAQGGGGSAQGGQAQGGGGTAQGGQAQGGGGSGGSGPTDAIGIVGEACSSPGAVACNGHASKVTTICKGGAWDVLEVCPNGKVCDSAAGINQGTCQDIHPDCAGKQPGDTTCKGAVRVVCGADLVTVTDTDCGSELLCTLGSGPLCGVCTDGQYKCDGQTLQLCASSHLTFEFVETCTDKACNDVVGQCTNKLCVKDGFKCEGAQLQKCRDTEDGFDVVTDCPSADLCNSVNGTCNVCIPNQALCLDGVTAQQCDAAGATATTVACDAASPFCQGGACVQCTSDSDCPAQPDECSVAVCTAGACSIVYTPAQTQLTAQTAGDCKKLVCNGTGGIDTVNDDADVPSDDNNKCTVEGCAGGAPKTTFAAQGTDCEANKKCDASGTCGSCTEGDQRCVNNRPQKCTGGAFVDQAVCGAATPICIGLGQCVACVVDTDCPATGDPCKVAVCSGNICTTGNAPQGTVVPTQSDNDCKTSVCDGNGGLTAVANATDLPKDDGNVCTNQACNGTSPSFPPVAAGTSCGGAKVCTGTGICGDCVPGTKRCNGTKVEICNASGVFATDTTCSGATPFCSEGSCVECTADANCTTSNECKTGACGVDKKCTYSNKASGTTTSQQTSGDCKKNVCDGNGSIVSQPDTNDKPNDNNACTSDTCSGSTPTYSNLPAGTDCAAGKKCDGQGTCGSCSEGQRRCLNGVPQLCSGGVYVDQTACSGATPVCDSGTGTCVGCLSNSDCVAANECVVSSCNAATKTCANSNVAAGTVTSAQSAGDCKKNVCDGNGNITANADTSDLPVDDGNPCTDQVCQGSTPAYLNTSPGTTCAVGKVCTGTGICADCAPNSKRCSSATQPQVCNASGAWVNAAACSSPTPVCSSATGTCVQCTGDAQCSTGNPTCYTPRCNTATNTCYDELKPVVCGDGKVCGTELCDDGKVNACGSCNASCTGPGNGMPNASCDGACSDGSTEEFFGPDIVGCAAKTAFANRASTCAAGWMPCTADQWMKWRDGSPVDYAYWTNDTLKWSGGQTTCSVSTTVGNSCSGSSMAVCPKNGVLGNATTDALGNTCNWTSCGFGAADPNESYGGCIGSDTAGTLCCRAPCANGAVPADVFPDGMIGCATKQTYAKAVTNSQYCGAGYHLCSLKEYLQRRGNVAPTHNYWLVNPSLNIDNGALNTCAGRSGTQDIACSAAAPLHVCGPSTDAEGNICTTRGCGYEQFIPGDFLGGCGTNDTNAGALCCADSPCADGTVEQVFTGGLVGCGGVVKYVDRGQLCGQGCTVATVDQYRALRAGDKPTHIYWTNDDLRYGGNGDEDCLVSKAGGTQCKEGDGTLTPMRVCGGHSDAEGNACNWTECGFEATMPGEYFGGCSGNLTAGTLCFCGGL